MSIILRWGVPALVTVVGGTSLAISTTNAQMTGELTVRASSVLAVPGLDWASVSFDARDAVITGTAADQQSIDDAAMRVATVRGVRSVRSAAVLAEFVSPFPFRAAVQDGEVVLSGGVPNETAHAEIVLSTGSANDTLKLMSGAPRTEAWRAAVDYGLIHLAHFDEGEIALSDLELTITGRAKSAESFDALKLLANERPPEGVTVADWTVQPPLASPFKFEATFDGTRVAVSGFTPTEHFAEDLLEQGVGGRPVSPSLVLASGAAGNFEERARALLENLVLLEEGSATISDSALTLDGSPADPATAEAVTLAMTRIGATVSLSPPRADRYEFVALRLGGMTRLSGHVPDAPTRDRLEAIAGVDAAELELARGAPERFDSGVEFGLGLLNHLSEGKFVLDNTRLSIEGRAETAADFAEVETIIALGAPQGLILAATDVKPPLASPFRWSAEKGDGGSIRMDGFVPSRAARDAFRAAVPELAADTATIADGNPANFETEALAALGLLPEMTTARIAFDGGQWSITGAVDSRDRLAAVESAFAAAGLDAAGWTLDLEAPPEPEPETAALPVTDPYLWRATKAADGTVTLDGFVTSEELKRFFAVRAGSVTADTTEISPGEPDGFVANALAGLEALRHLSPGTAEYANGAWSLSGTPASRADAEMALAAIADPSTGDQVWNTAIAEPVAPAVDVEPAPETDIAAVPEEVVAAEPEPVPSFVFLARKPLDGTIAVEGEVPNEAARSLFGLVAGTATPDSLTLNTGLPPDFTQRADTGIRLLAGLDAGEFSFDGTKWSLSGRVESEAERETILAVVSGLPAATDWQTDIALLPPLDICRRKVDAFAGRNAILFQSGSARLADESLPAIDELVGYLEACPNATVYVEGHTDSDGADDLNLALSVTRAETVVGALIDRGVSFRRLYAVGYGEGLPIADNNTAAGKRANRRIAFSILDPAE